MILSAQQNKAIAMLKKYNIILDCVPGSGKTTTIIHIAKQYPKQNVLVLTYNSKLKCESRDKIVKMELTNCIVHSYHSFFHNNYGHCIDDSLMKSILKNNVAPKNTYEYDLIILDEAQDITPLYYEAICKIVKDNNRQIKMAIFGDRKQNIYSFNGADSRFLEQSIKLFHFSKFNKSKWKKINLDVTFRLTDKIASFVNNCIIDNDCNAVKLKALQTNCLTDVKYIICDPMINNNYNNIYVAICDLLNQGYAPKDIFILAPSIKSSKGPIKILANILSNNGIPIYFPEEGDETINEKDINDKLCISSFHRVKGLERKAVIIFNFDMSYYEYYARHDDRSICPNVLYVALTRAREQLILIHSSNFGYLPFLNYELLKLNCDINTTNTTQKKNNAQKFHIISHKTIVDHIESKVIDKSNENISVKIVKGKSKIELNKSVSTFCNDKEISECVFNINSIAIPSYLEYIYTGDVYIRDSHDILPDECSVEKFLRMAAKYYANAENMNFKLRQIPNFKWITQQQFNECASKMMKRISPNTIFNTELTIFGSRDLCGKKITCKYDCIDKNTAWFFFFNKKIDNPMITKLLIASYILKVNTFDISHLKLNMYIKFKCSGKIFKGNVTKINSNKTVDVITLEKEKKTIYFKEIVDIFKNIRRLNYFNPLTGDILSIKNNVHIGKLRNIVNNLLVKKYESGNKYMEDSRFIQTIKNIKFKYFA